MMIGIWGRKIGMTQIFSQDKVVPVTAIDIADWYVTNIKTKERDGYSAVQLGSVKDRYRAQKFNMEWLKQLKRYFSFVREVHLKDDTVTFKVGRAVDFSQLLTLGEKVDVFGVTRGLGFAGVVKRHGFTGAVASHGSTMGRRPGSIGSLVKSGFVARGKKLPGRMGGDRRVMRKLEVVMIKPETRTLLVKGSIPGKTGSLIFVRRAQVNNE